MASLRPTGRAFRRLGAAGFTLIELLVIVAIIATLVGIGVGSIRSGQGAARVKGAARDIFAAIRQARSTALVTGQPAIITYSTVEEDGEVMAKVEITSAKLLGSGVDRSKIVTLTGEPVPIDPDEANASPVEETKSTKRTGSTEEETPASSDEAGETLEEILFTSIDADIVKGMRLKVALAGEEGTDTSKRTSKISVFSNVDFLLGRFKAARASTNATATASSTASGTTVGAAKEELQAPVSVVWETNGRVDPHQVWIYADGQRPEDGLSIKIDRFGAAKVVSGDGREDE